MTAHKILNLMSVINFFVLKTSAICGSICAIKHLVRTNSIVLCIMVQMLY